MRQVNLSARTPRSKYPFLQEFKGTWMLSLTENAHVFRRGEQLVCSEDSEGKHILTKSANNLSVLFQTLEEAHAGRWFGEVIKVHPLPHCLTLSYLIEVVGDREELWEALTGDGAHIIENFFYKLGRPVDISVAMSALRPLDITDLGERAVKLRLALAYGTEVLGVLSFSETSISIRVCASTNTVYAHALNFQSYDSLVQPTVSRREYYFLLWSRLWRQVIAVVGLRCTSSRFFTASFLEGATKSFSNAELDALGEYHQVSEPLGVLKSITDFIM